VVHGATVGDHCLVGIGARALNGSELGEGAWLASGAVLPEGRVIPPWTLAVGIPAKPLRELTETEIDRQRSGVDDYLRLGATYREMFR
jgi:carbonic anhydrase/acetyltransferase-like protein (isoleucine patch superfamily)